MAQLDPPPSNVELIKENFGADAIWKQWFNFLFEVVSDLQMTFFTQTAFTGTPTVAILATIEGVNSPYTIQLNGGATGAFNIQMKVSGSLDGTNFDTATLMTVTDSIPVEISEIEVQYTHLQFEGTSVTGTDPTLDVILGGFE